MEMIISMDKNVEDSITKKTKQWERDCMEMCPGVNLYTLPGLSFFIANRPMDFPAGQHSHNEYEFMMPLDAPIAAQSDAQTIVLEKGRFTPFNSGQSHGVVKDTTAERVICISCEKGFLERLALLGFGKAEIHFENISFEISNNIRFLLGLFVEESLSQKRGYHVMQDNLANMLCTELIRCSRNSITMTNPQEKENEKIGITRAADFLKEQVLTSFSIDEAAQVAGLSPYYFIRAFKQHIGKTPYAYYVDVKIEKAKELLQNKTLSVMEIALATGFANSGHFSTVFKRRTGVTPSEYKKMVC